MRGPPFDCYTLERSYLVQSTGVYRGDLGANEGQRGRVVSASDSRSGGRGIDSRPCHVVVTLGKQFTLTFPSPPTCKMGTQLQAILEFMRLQHPADGFKVALNVLVCWGICGAALVATQLR
ncbi:hypothetical protein ElyMa_001729000 [Elysia marginata]|uniref:Uncharacterized protein n=1 Tax=Elysia marginata TaxID=1093978 RepID=A0AAV4JYF1_9GAST|nr:hypothetical protein ElyMa_001729000 [Elysia marginata]